jgi:hypothetical protein
MHFWTGMDKNFNNSVTNLNKLNDVYYGISWHKFELDIHNQATTRKDYWFKVELPMKLLTLSPVKTYYS